MINITYYPHDNVDSNANNPQKRPVGLHLFIGPMFSGKSTELIRQGDILNHIGLKGICIRSRGSSRNHIDGSPSTMSSRFLLKSLPCVEVYDIMDLLSTPYVDMDYFMIDESQFIVGLLEFCTEMVFNRKKLILLSYLSGKFDQTAFRLVETTHKEPTRGYCALDELIAIASDVKLLHAMCKQCKTNTAPYTWRLGQNSSDVVIGDSNYVTLCVNCLIKNRETQ